MRIPEFLNRDDYLQNPILRRFLKDHRISFVENRADYIREIEAYEYCAKWHCTQPIGFEFRGGSFERPEDYRRTAVCNAASTFTG